MCIFNEKRCGYGSCDVYDIFEIPGFTELPDVKNALRKVSVPGCERNGRDGHGNVFRLDEETIIKRCITPTMLWCSRTASLC